MDLPKVSIVTITYNHENYILEALKSFLDQDYNGPIEVIIANDNSPDNTHEVVTTFLENTNIPDNFEIKYTNHIVNKGMMSNFRWALQQATGKYIALCEGDDYWTDSLKLKKQVDLLEINKDCVGCFHNAKFLKNKQFIKDYIADVPDGIIPVQDAIIKGGGLFPTSAFLFKNSLKFYIDIKEVRAGDTYVLYSLIDQGNIYYTNFFGSVYRIHDNGIYSGIKNDKNKIIKDFLSNFYIIYSFSNQSLKYKKEYKQAIQYQLKRLSNRIKTYEILPFVINGNIKIIDYLKFIFNKMKR